MSRQTATGEATPTLRMLGHMARGYSRIFTESSWADRLSPASQVCRSGFDARLEVVGVQTVAADVMVITLCRPDRSPLPSWTPGAHIDVFTPTGRQRHYSLIGSPFDRLRYRIAVRKIPHGVGSAELHQLQVGEHLQVRGPRNAFNLASADEYLFLAGGIGITPILPMVQAVSARTNRWRLIYTGSSRDAMPFADELVAIDDDRVDIRPDDRHGVPDIEGLLAGISSRTALYVCGPIAMIDRARQVADQRAPASEVHSERFGAPPVINARSFAVNLARSGIRVDVGSNESALQAIRRSKPDVQYSCQQGFCGACRVAVLDGDVEHRDRVLTPGQRTDSMMICVSRAAGDAITIDL